VRELEFLPEDYLRARFQRRIGFIRSWLLLAIGLAMVLYSFQMGMWVRDAQAELLALRGTGLAVEADVEKVRRLRQEARVYTDRLGRTEALRPRITVASVLARVAEALPETAVLEVLDVVFPAGAKAGTATLRLEGFADSEEGVTQTVASLDALPRFSRTLLVESKPATGGPDGARTFAVEANIAPDTQIQGN